MGSGLGKRPREEAWLEFLKPGHPPTHQTSSSVNLRGTCVSNLMAVAIMGWSLRPQQSFLWLAIQTLQAKLAL